MDDYLWKIFDYNNLILKYYVIKCNRLYIENNIYLFYDKKSIY